jgi:hypothetical protein
VLLLVDIDSFYVPSITVLRWHYHRKEREYTRGARRLDYVLPVAIDLLVDVDLPPNMCQWRLTTSVNNTTTFIGILTGGNYGDAKWQTIVAMVVVVVVGSPVLVLVDVDISVIVDMFVLMHVNLAFMVIITIMIVVMAVVVVVDVLVSSTAVIAIVVVVVMIVVVVVVVVTPLVEFMCHI